MPINKTPVQTRERTGGIASGEFGIESTGFAMVAHARNVRATRNVRLAGETPRVGVLTHADHVWGHNPVESIDVQAQKPVVDRLRRYSCQQRKIAEHHQALNMMRVTSRQDLHNRTRDAAHVGRASPVKIW